MSHEETERLREELEQYKQEKEQIRMLLGQIGGKRGSKKEQLVDIIMVGAVVILFVLDLFGQIFNYHILPQLFSLELAIMLVSLKIIWMMYRQSKVEHFQFWILNSIEFRLNDLSKDIQGLKKKLTKD